MGNDIFKDSFLQQFKFHGLISCQNNLKVIYIIDYINKLLISTK